MDKNKEKKNHQWKISSPFMNPGGNCTRSFAYSREGMGITCHQNCSCSDPDTPLIPRLTDHIKAWQAHQASNVIRSSMPPLLSIKPIIKIILCASVETFICRSPGASWILNNRALNQMWVTTHTQQHCRFGAEAKSYVILGWKQGGLDRPGASPQLFRKPGEIVLALAICSPRYFQPHLVYMG